MLTNYWEVDIRSRKNGESIETIFSDKDQDKAYDCLNKWYDKHPELNIEAPRTDYIDGTDGVFADIYCTNSPHGVGKWD